MFPFSNAAILMELPARYCSYAHSTAGRAQVMTLSSNAQVTGNAQLDSHAQAHYDYG